MVRRGYPCGDTLEELSFDLHITPERMNRIKKLLLINEVRKYAKKWGETKTLPNQSFTKAK